MQQPTQAILTRLTLSVAALATVPAYANEAVPALTPQTRSFTAKDTLDAATAAIAEAHRAPHRGPYSVAEPDRNALASSINSAPATPGQETPAPLHSIFSDGPNTNTPHVPRQHLVVPDGSISTSRHQFLNH